MQDKKWSTIIYSEQQQQEQDDPGSIKHCLALTNIKCMVRIGVNKETQLPERQALTLNNVNMKRSFTIMDKMLDYVAQFSSRYQEM